MNRISKSNRLQLSSLHKVTPIPPETGTQCYILVSFCCDSSGLFVQARSHDQAQSAPYVWHGESRPDQLKVCRTVWHCCCWHCCCRCCCCCCCHRRFIIFILRFIIIAANSHHSCHHSYIIHTIDDHPSVLEPFKSWKASSI